MRRSEDGMARDMILVGVCDGEDIDPSPMIGVRMCDCDPVKRPRLSKLDQIRNRRRDGKNHEDVFGLVGVFSFFLACCQLGRLPFRLQNNGFSCKYGLEEFFQPRGTTQAMWPAQPSGTYGANR